MPAVLSIANAMFVQRRETARDEFLRIMASQYGTGAQAVDFTSPTAIEVIGAWVREQTADRIRKLFDQLPPETKAVLANAVYFNGDWALTWTWCRRVEYRCSSGRSPIRPTRLERTSYFSC